MTIVTSKIIGSSELITLYEKLYELSNIELTEIRVIHYLLNSLDHTFVIDSWFDNSDYLCLIYESKTKDWIIDAPLLINQGSSKIHNIYKIAGILKIAEKRILKYIKKQNERANSEITNCD